MSISIERIFDFPPSEKGQYRALICELNGGTITVSADNGDDFILTDTITEDGATVLFVEGLRIRVTPSGGANYWWSKSK